MDEFWIGIFIISLIIFAEMCYWARGEYRKWKARQKSKAAEPIDCTGIDFTYDSKGHRKQIRRELYESMKERRKGA